MSRKTTNQAPPRRSSVSFSTSAAASSRNDLLQHFKQSFATSNASSLLEKKRKISDLIIENIDEDERQLFGKSAKLDTSATKQHDDSSSSSSFNIDDVLEDCERQQCHQPSPSVVSKKPIKTIRIQKSPNESFDDVDNTQQRCSGHLSFIEKILEGADEEDDGSHSPVIVQGKTPPNRRLARLDMSTLISSQLDDEDEQAGDAGELSQLNDESKAIESPNLTQNHGIVDNQAQELVQHSRLMIDDSYLEQMATLGDRQQSHRLTSTKYNVDELLGNEYRIGAARKASKTHHRIQNSSLLDEILQSENSSQKIQKPNPPPAAAADLAVSAKTSQSRSDREESEVLSQSIEILSLKDSNQSEQETIRDDADEVDECDDSRLDEGVEMTAIEDDTLERAPGETTSKTVNEWLKETSGRKKPVVVPLIDSSSFEEGGKKALLDQQTGGSTISFMAKNEGLNELLQGGGGGGGKKRTRYVKNGYAEKLHKLLVRQASSLNFIRHNIDKYKQDMESMTTQQDMQPDNVIKCCPVYKQSSSVVLKFTLVHALTISSEPKNSGKYIYLFFPNEHDGLRWLNDEAKLKDLVIKIYPPWRKMFLKSLNKEVFFCTNLIEMSLISTGQHQRTQSAHVENVSLFRLANISCNRCRVPEAPPQEVECDMSLFQVSKILQKSKNSFMRSDLQDHQDLRAPGTSSSKGLSPSQQIRVKETAHVPEFILYTQTDAEYYLKAALTQGSNSSTQYMRENSILDAIESSGYLGLVSFKATVQRSSIFAHSSTSRSWQHLLTQSSQPQQSQLAASYQRKQVIVTDKCGVFALIAVPLRTRVTESYKYRFVSLRLIEKLDLYQEENETVMAQIRLLWEKMNGQATTTAAHSKSYPKIINSFEYLETPSSPSSLETLGASKNYIPLPSFCMIKALVETLDNTRPGDAQDNFLINLNDVILLKLVESYEGTMTLYYLVALTDEDNFRVCHISLDSVAHFESSELLSLLESNHICLGRYLGGLTSGGQDQDQRIICINNLSADHLKRINATGFTWISTSEPDPTSPDLQLIDSIDFNKMNALRSTFKYMERQRKILKHDFIQISLLSIVDVCLKTSSVSLSCSRSRCQAEANSLNRDPTSNEWTCRVCQQSMPAPEISVSLTVVIECKGPSGIKYLKLHDETVAALIPPPADIIDKLTRREAQINEFLDVTLIVNKQLGPIFAFVSEVDDEEIKLEELQPSFVSPAPTTTNLTLH